LSIDSTNKERVTMPKYDTREAAEKVLAWAQDKALEADVDGDGRTAEKYREIIAKTKAHLAELGEQSPTEGV